MSFGNYAYFLKLGILLFPGRILKLKILKACKADGCHF